MEPTKAQVEYYIAQRSHVFACRLLVLGFVGFVTVMLKVGGWIDWSWAWALSPWWFGWIYSGTWFIGMLIYNVTVKTEEREVQ